MIIHFTANTNTLVKYFNNEKFETEQYDKSLEKYEQSSLKIATSLAALNAGQNAIFSSALTMMMFLSAQGVMNGKLSDVHVTFHISTLLMCLCCKEH